MATTGATLPGSGTSTTPSGSGATWNDASNITSDDNLNATTTTAGNGESGHLVASSFGFNISASSIGGIEVTIGAFYVTGAQTLYARLRNSSGTLVGSTKNLYINTSSESTFTFGGSADMWGTSLAQADINSTSFGVEFYQDGFYTYPISIDWVKIDVTYTQTTSVSSSGVFEGSSSLTAVAAAKVESSTGLQSATSIAAIAKTTVSASGGIEGTASLTVIASPPLVNATTTVQAGSQIGASPVIETRVASLGPRFGKVGIRIGDTTQRYASSFLEGTTSLSAKGVVDASISTTLEATSSLSAIANVIVSISSAISGSAELVASAIATVNSSSTQEGQATLSAAAQANVTVGNQVLLAGAELTAAAGASVSSGATQSANSQLSAAWEIPGVATAILSGSASLTAAPVVTVFPASALSATASLTALAVPRVAVSATNLQASGSLVATPATAASGSSTLSAVGTLTAVAGFPANVYATATMSGVATLTAFGLDLCPCPPWQNEATLQNLFKSEDTLANTWKRKPCG